MRDYTEVFVLRILTISYEKPYSRRFIFRNCYNSIHHIKTQRIKMILFYLLLYENISLASRYNIHSYFCKKFCGQSCSKF